MSASVPNLDETSAYAIEAVRRSDRPLNAKQVRELIPTPARVPDSQLDSMLAAAVANGALFLWPPHLSRAVRYWSRRPEDHAESRLLELLAANSLGLSDIEESLTRDLSGHSGAKRKALLRSSVASLKKRGSLYEYPKLGRKGLKYSQKPAEPGPYLCALKKEFEALAAKLQSAGITPEQIIAELTKAPAPAHPPSPAPPDLEPSILDHLKGRPGGMSLRELWSFVRTPGATKSAFDQAVLSLYASNRVYLDRHDRPSLLNDAERDELVSDGAGSYYIGITLRGAGDQSI